VRIFVDPGLDMSWWNLPALYMVLVGLACIVVWHVIPQRLSTARLIVQIAFFKASPPLLLDRPEMAEDLAAVLSARMSSLGGSGAAGQQHTSSKFALLKALQTVFHPVPARFERRQTGRARRKKAMSIRQIGVIDIVMPASIEPASGFKVRRALPSRYCRLHYRPWRE
jgi:hypothetical protein